MILTKLEAEKKYPNVTFIGSRFDIGKNVSIGTGTCIEYPTIIMDDVTIHPNCHIGAHVTLHREVSIGAWVQIGKGTTIFKAASINKDSCIGEEVSIGDLVDISHNVIIGDNSRIGKNVCISNKSLIGSGVSVGSWAYVGPFTEIGNNVTLADGVLLKSEATVGAGAIINVVHSTFRCNIAPFVDHVEIQMGCERHTINEWESDQWEIAANNCPYDDLSKSWWHSDGQYIFRFLVDEANRYAAAYIQTVEVQEERK